MGTARQDRGVCLELMTGQGPAPITARPWERMTKCNVRRFCAPLSDVRICLCRQSPDRRVMKPEINSPHGMKPILGHVWVDPAMVRPAPSSRNRRSLPPRPAATTSSSLPEDAALCTLRFPGNLWTRLSLPLFRGGDRPPDNGVCLEFMTRSNLEISPSGGKPGHVVVTLQRSYRVRCLRARLSFPFRAKGPPVRRAANRNRTVGP